MTWTVESSAPPQREVQQAAWTNDAGDTGLGNFVRDQVYPAQFRPAPSEPSSTNIRTADRYVQLAGDIQRDTPAQQRDPDPMSPAELDRAGKAMADLIQDRGRLDMNSREGELAFLMMYQAYRLEGEAGVQKLIDAINKNLNGDFKLTMRDDPEFTKRVQDEMKKEGKTPPEFVRRIDVQDRNGRNRGNLIFMYGKGGNEGSPI